MLYPVIMCGGAGTRLWPASRPSRPKQFLALSGPRSLFQETVLRVAPLTDRGGEIIVVGGVAHGAWIADQLAQIGVEAKVLLEPAARDSAAAMAAAAAWTHRDAADGVNVFVASDHHIPDPDAFRHAVTLAVADAVRGRIVTLGVRPTEPSSAYGYIQPGTEGAGPEGLAPVQAFVEKPDAATAVRYIEAGYLWNSGNFIARAEILLSELDLHAPGVAASARAALPNSDGQALVGQATQTLTPAFLDAPRISIDYAVMEKTKRASVLPVDFAWSDLGAWDAIRATGNGGVGPHVMDDSEGCLIRTQGDVLVATLGVKNLAIIVEPDAVLVCDIDRAQEVKTLVERIRASSPGHLDFAADKPERLEDAGVRFLEWMRLRALPIWSTLGQTQDGAFAEAMSLIGQPAHCPRRMRVQARQTHVYAQAGLAGWRGNWAQPAGQGIRCLVEHYQRPDGIFRTLLNPDMSPLDETAMIYDQAFVLLALASTKLAGLGGQEMDSLADTVRKRIFEPTTSNGAVIEAGKYPYQSNAHMHLLEAALAWEEVAGGEVWVETADRIVRLAQTVFIDREGGFLREFFGSEWQPAPGADGALVEPGHQFEWAWLIARVAIARENPDLLETAKRLYAFGMRGLCSRRGVVVDALETSGAIRTAQARLWPQTEWAKAALILCENTTGAEREIFLEHAAMAVRAIQAYLTPDGFWHDKMTADGYFVDEPAPASSLYHILGAALQLGATAKRCGFTRIANLPLA